MQVQSEFLFYNLFHSEQPNVLSKKTHTQKEKLFENWSMKKTDARAESCNTK